MLLRPRKFKFKNLHKNRLFRKTFSGKNSLSYGDSGIQLTQPCLLTSKKLFRFGLFLKKGSRRSDKTSRKVWLRAFPHLPLTKKVAGSRMGKGKGKLSDWYSKIPQGSIFIEYKNLRRGRSKYFLNQVRYRLSPTSILLFKFKSSRCNYLPLNYSKKVTFQNFQ